MCSEKAFFPCPCLFFPESSDQCREQDSKSIIHQMIFAIAIKGTEHGRLLGPIEVAPLHIDLRSESLNLSLLFQGSTPRPKGLALGVDALPK